uniref:Inositol hexakisphosphate and diphosphoinositol-pentakisphosphate kinase n=1 Tax=Clastoptera arizonana TaxID=38151 RepID=A0A1B6D4P0_9HEMI
MSECPNCDLSIHSWTWWKDWWRLKKWRPNDKPVIYCDQCGDLSELNDDEICAEEGKQVVVGVCAMARKSQSKPMKEILTRLQEFEYIKMIVFAEEKPVHEWPIVDCLISFHSKGFPLEKAIQYSVLRNPFIINNLHMQFDIQDRRKVYSILESEGIEIPRYAVLDRDSPDPSHHELIESEDHVEVNGIVFNKPFVEKPVSAEDHNIYIYYPTSAGGGSQRLFRKIGSRSSVYSPESRVRKTGSFIYEDFMPTDGTDVKVYTVGPDYAHAEARKSPALDGKVERDSEGKEIRYPVILSNAEKLISRKVCLAFKQTVCGFDLLRANGKSFVCDVNGFSFVKNSNKYYDDCAKILGNMILRELAPTLHIPWSVPFQLDDPPIVPTTFGKMMELRCVVGVIRHGDRTPKQKMKVEVRHPKFFEIFEKYGGRTDGHVKLKRPKQLQEILDIARSLLSEIEQREADPEIEEKQGKLEQLKSVLEMYGHFSGINRKVQMKYQPKGRPRGSSSDDGKGNMPKEPSLVLILKWGGELTPAGRVQAEELGRIFRCMYPGGQGRHASGEYAGTQGLGLLRLHSTFRHDLKIYASDEGRVQMTAAAFAKGLLALEGELTPILVQMVKSANTNGLLDNDCDASKHQNMAKARLHELMQQDRLFTPEDRELINPCNSISITIALDFVKNPVKCCERVQDLIQRLMNIVRTKKDDPKTKDAILYHGETWELMMRRWGKIEKDFCTKNKTFDISKIPDIYDCIKYDLQHNQHTVQFEQAEELYICAKYLADIVIPQEYGLTKIEKLTISQGICTPLLKKIRADLQRNIEESGDESVNRLNPRYSHGVSSPGRHVRTRLYFTSESHIHSLITVLRHGGLLDCIKDEQWRRAMEYVSMVSELNYMSQVVVMLYEDPTKDPCSEERFHVELHFSPGVNCCVQKNLPPGPGFRPHSRNDQSKHFSSDQEEVQTDESTSSTPVQNSPTTEKVNAERKFQDNSGTSEFKGKLIISEPIPIRPLTKLIHETDPRLRMVDEQNQNISVSAQESRSPCKSEQRARSYDQKRANEKSECNTDNTFTISSFTSDPKSLDMSGVLHPVPSRAIIKNKLFEKNAFSCDELKSDQIESSKYLDINKEKSLKTKENSLFPIKIIRSLSAGFGLPESKHSDNNYLGQFNSKTKSMYELKSNQNLRSNRLFDIKHSRICVSTDKLDIRSLDLANVEIYTSENRKIKAQYRRAYTYKFNYNHIDKYEQKMLTRKDIVKTNQQEKKNTDIKIDVENERKVKINILINDKIDETSNKFTSSNKHISSLNSNKINSNLIQPSEINSVIMNYDKIKVFSSKDTLGEFKNREDLDYNTKRVSNNLDIVITNEEGCKVDCNDDLCFPNTIYLGDTMKEVKQTFRSTELNKGETSHLTDSSSQDTDKYDSEKIDYSRKYPDPNHFSGLLSEKTEFSNNLELNTFQINQNIKHGDNMKPFKVSNNEFTTIDMNNYTFPYSSVCHNMSGKKDIDDNSYSNDANCSNDLVEPPKFLRMNKIYSTQKSAPELYSNSHNTNSDFRIIDDPEIMENPISETRVSYPSNQLINETDTSAPIDSFPTEPKYYSHPMPTRRTHSVSHCLEMSHLSPPIDPGPSRRHRHGISGQMSYFRVNGYGLIIQHQKRGTSGNSLFSTAVISGSSSAPNLRDMIPNSASVTAAIDGCGGVPSIRPLETLHNALSLKQLDGFLDTMTHSNLYRTPISTPPKVNSAPLQETVQSPSNSMVWSGPPSFVSSSGPSSPNALSDFFRGTSGTSDSSEMSASIVSNDGLSFLGPGLSSMSKLEDENSYYSHREIEELYKYKPQLKCAIMSLPLKDVDSGELTPISVGSDVQNVYQNFMDETIDYDKDKSSKKSLKDHLESDAMVCEDEEEEKTLTAFTKDECSRPSLAEIKWHIDDADNIIKKFAYGRFKCSEAILEKPLTEFHNTGTDIPSVSTIHYYSSNEKSVSPPFNKKLIENEKFSNEEMFIMDCEDSMETSSSPSDIQTEDTLGSGIRERRFSEMSNQTVVCRSVSPVLASGLKDSKNVARGFVVSQTKP